MHPNSAPWRSFGCTRGRWCELGTPTGNPRLCGSNLAARYSLASSSNPPLPRLAGVVMQSRWGSALRRPASVVRCSSLHPPRLILELPLQILARCQDFKQGCCCRSHVATIVMLRQGGCEEHARNAHEGGTGFRPKRGARAFG